MFRFSLLVGVALITAPAYAAFTEADLFTIDVEYRADVAQMLNLLHAEHPACAESLQPMTALRARVSDNPANPAFTVVCGKAKPRMVHFTWMDAVNRRVPEQPPLPLVVSQGEAHKACEAAAQQRASRPGTVDMSRFWSAAFHERVDGTAEYSTTFTAANAFGARDEYQIVCQFRGKTLTDAAVRPAR